MKQVAPLGFQRLERRFADDDLCGAAAGLFLGTGAITEGLNALSLVAVNVVCVNLAATATFLVQGIRPDTWWEADRARSATVRALVVWVVLLLLLAALLVIRAAPRAG